ncbi:MAG: hypothetical protein SH856_04170 [Flavobacteriales bacterium]|nr:hypothetical protein [Flavobacteriales bacterium]
MCCAQETTNAATNATTTLTEAEKANSAKACFKAARIDEKELRYDDARVLCRKAVELQPKNPLYLNDFGGFLSAMGEYDEAIQYL